MEIFASPNRKSLKEALAKVIKNPSWYSPEVISEAESLTTCGDVSRVLDPNNAITLASPEVSGDTPIIVAWYGWGCHQDWTGYSRDDIIRNLQNHHMYNPFKYKNVFEKLRRGEILPQLPF